MKIANVTFFGVKIKKIVKSKQKSKKKESKKQKQQSKPKLTVNQQVVDLVKKVNKMIDPTYVATFGKPQPELDLSQIEGPSHLTVNPDVFKYQHLPNSPLNLTKSSLEEQNTTQVQLADKRKFQPIEELTGISHDRPQIISLVDFQPLYQEEINNTINQHDISSIKYQSSNLTDAGLLFDARTNELRIQNYVANSGMLRINPLLLIDYVKNLTTLKEMSEFLRLLVQKTQKMRQAFDLRDESHVIMGRSPTSLQTFLSSQNYINSHEFSSTKLWIQSVIEYKNLLKGHGRSIKEMINGHQGDKSPFRINTSKSNDAIIFGSELNSPLPTISEIKKFTYQRIDDHSIVNAINAGYHGLYKNLPRQQENQLAGILWLLTQEYRYSNGLSSADVRAALNAYGYQFTPGTSNVNLFDVILGTSTRLTYEIPATMTNSLCNLAYTKPSATTAVMNFENSYLRLDDSVFTPGSEYFIDSIFDDVAKDKLLSFDNLTAFDQRLTQTVNNLGLIAQKMNWMGESRADVSIMNAQDLEDKREDLEEMLHTSATAQLKEFETKFLNSKSDKVGLKSDYLNTWIGALLRLAADPQNTKLKSMLFVMAMSQSVRDRKDTSDFTKPVVQSNDTDISQYVNENTTTTGEIQDRLFEQIMNEIRRLLSNNQYIRTFVPRAIDRNVTYDELKRSLLSSSMSKLWKTIINMMSSYVDWLYRDNQVVTSSRTRYRGLVDTTMVMSYFDAIVRFIAKYSEIEFGVVLPGTKEKTFHLVRATNVSIDREFVTRVKSLLIKEQDELLQGYQTIILTVNSLSRQVKDYINFVFDQQNANESGLNKIKKSLGNIDNRIMRILLQEQHSLLLHSTISDVLDIVKSENNLNDSADNRLKIFDLHLRSADFKEYCLAAFGLDEFRLNRGNAKVMSVGIPIGFTEKLQQEYRVERSNQQSAGSISGFVRRQGDIITVNVHRIDVRFPDVIFHPRKFKFEMSRFPVRSSGFYPVLPKKPTLDDVIDRVPMRDILQKTIGSERDAIYYGSSKIIDKFKTSSHILQTNSSIDLGESYSSSDYDFLTQSDKRELIRNHAISFLLELYVKFMTDVHVSEHSIYMDPTHAVNYMKKEFADDIIKGLIGYVASARKKKEEEHNRANYYVPAQYRQPMTMSDGLENTPSVYRSYVANERNITILQEAFKELNLDFSRQSLADVVKDVSSADYSLITKMLRDMISVFMSHTNASDIDSVMRTMFGPRQFERVFHVLIDPDDFVIDHTQTIKTPQGRDALQRMLLEGLVIDVRNTPQWNKMIQEKMKKTKASSNPLDSGSPFYVYRSANKNAGDFNLDKYFVVIESEVDE